MKNLLTLLVLAILMALPVIFVGGCQQCANTDNHMAATPAPADNANQDQNDNGSEWYGEAGSDR
jgi:hypothetical protein